MTLLSCFTYRFCSNLYWMLHYRIRISLDWVSSPCTPTSSSSRPKDTCSQLLFSGGGFLTDLNTSKTLIHFFYYHIHYYFKVLYIRLNGKIDVDLSYDHNGSTGDIDQIWRCKLGPYSYLIVKSSIVSFYNFWIFSITPTISYFHWIFPMFHTL